MRYSIAIILAGILALAVPAAAQQEEAPDCPTGLTGQALRDGGVFMSWTLNSQTDVRIYRAVGDGALVLIDQLEFPATKYIDHNTDPGGTYRYEVRAVTEAGVESAGCSTFGITAVPFFPGALTLGLAALVGVAGYAVFRRRSS